MHVKPPFIISLPLIIPSILAAPIYQDSHQDLIARGVTQPVPQAAMPNSHLTQLASGTPASSGGPSRVAFPGNGASRFNNLKLTTQFSPGGGAPCPHVSLKGKDSSNVCRSSLNSPGESPHDINHEHTELSVHPEGINGPDTNTVKKLTVGTRIGGGKQAKSNVYTVPKHEFGNANLAVKVYHERANKIEMSHLRELGQLRASGKCNGHDCIVMSEVKGTPLTQTKAFSDAAKRGHIAVSKVVQTGKKLMGDARFNHMQNDGLLHNAVNEEHVKFEVDEMGHPVKANLVGWGNAVLAPKRGPEEVYHPKLERSVRRLETFKAPFEFPPNKRIGSQPVLPPSRGWDHRKA